MSGPVVSGFTLRNWIIGLVHTCLPPVWKASTYPLFRSFFDDWVIRFVHLSSFCLESIHTMIVSFFFPTCWWFPLVVLDGRRSKSLKDSKTENKTGCNSNNTNSQVHFNNIVYWLNVKNWSWLSPGSHAHLCFQQGTHTCSTPTSSCLCVSTSFCPSLCTVL